MFLLGEKLVVVRSCECSVSVVFRPSVTGGMRVFYFLAVGERAFEQGYSALRPLARTENLSGHHRFTSAVSLAT